MLCVCLLYQKQNWKIESLNIIMSLGLKGQSFSILYIATFTFDLINGLYFNSNINTKIIYI